MLALQPLQSKRNHSVPNVLPCRIHHSGPAKVTKRFWAPSRDNDNTATSYFRGRKLRGRTLKLPPGFIGIAATPTERLVPQEAQPAVDGSGADRAASGAEDELDDDPEPVKLLQSTATFDEITVWGHDILPAADDPFVKGIEEWIAFAEAVHGQIEAPEVQAA